MKTFASPSVLYPDGTVMECGEYGMDLRDYFAAKALPLVICQMNSDSRDFGARNPHQKQGFAWFDDDDPQGHSDCWIAAERAYVMADAMMEVRNQKPNGK